MKNKFIKVLALVITLIMLLSIVPSQVVWALDSMTLKVDTVSTVTGSTVQVKISIENNPGISSIKAKVAFDDILTLTSVEYNTEMGGQSVAPNKLSSPITLLWISAFGDYTNDATFATLTFKTPEGLSENKEANITVTFDPDDIYNVQEENVPMTVVNGKVDILTGIPGDINSDGKVNNKDASRLLQYLAGWEVEVDEYAVYTNGDDKANNKDATRLLQFLAGWPVMLYYGPFTAHQHTMEAIPAKAATCTQPGNNAYWHCTECGKYFSTENGSIETTPEAMAVKAKGHKPGEWTVLTPATESQAGLRVKTCERCGITTDSEEIPIIVSERYNIIYEIDNGDPYLASLNLNDKIPENKKTYTTKDGLDLPVVTVDGYRFIGWFDMPGGDYAENVKKIAPGETGTKTFYAHWTKETYKILFDSPDVAVPGASNGETTYTVDTGKPLKNYNPKWFGYTFVGWSIDGRIVSEIAPGTIGNITVHANWTSNRNMAKAVDNPQVQKIIEDADNGQYLFVYEIGTINNVPLVSEEDEQEENLPINTEGIDIEREITITQKVDKTTGERIAKTVSDATTKSSGWVLAEGWNNSTTATSEHDEQVGKTNATIDSQGNVVSGRYYVSNNQGGTTSISSSVGGSNSNSSKVTNSASIGITGNYGIEHQTKNSVKTEVANEQSHEFNWNIGGSYGQNMSSSLGGNMGASQGGLSAGLSAELSSGSNWGINGGIGGKDTSKTRETIGEETENGVKTNANISNSRNYSTGTETSTTSEGHWDTSKTSTSSWNTTTGYEKSSETSYNKTVSSEVSKFIYDKTGYSSMASRNGSNSETYSTGENHQLSDEYATTVEFSTEDTGSRKITQKIRSSATGYYRLVNAGTVHVFAVVGYDIATASYFTYTYNVLDKERHPYFDYSKETASFDDCENGIIPFEIPYEVEEYISVKIGRSDGLVINKNTGKVTKYEGTSEYVVIPEYISTSDGLNTPKAVRVSGIEKDVFSGKNIKAIILPKYITEIPENAFTGCTNLEWLIGPGIMSIGKEAFKGCTSLQTFVIDEFVNVLGEDAFVDVPELYVNAANTSVAYGALKSGAKQLIVSLSKMDGTVKDKKIVIPETTRFFALLSNGAEYENFTIESNAEQTFLSNFKLTNNENTPLKINSGIITLSEISVNDCPGYSLIIPCNNATVRLYGDVEFNSKDENSILSKSINLKRLNSEDAQMSITGNYLINGTLNNEDSLKINHTRGTMLPIDDNEFDRQIKAVKVVFDANGGAVSKESKTVFSDETYGDLPVPTRDYYVFDGWYTEKSGGEKVTAESVVKEKENIKIYAHWTINSYTAYFDGNGGDPIKTTIENINIGSNLDSMPTPTRDYYTFDGWYTAKSVGEGEKVTVDNYLSIVSKIDEESLVQNGITLYAHWTINPVSGWVKASEAPEDSQIVKERWNYTYRDWQTTNDTLKAAALISAGYTLDESKTTWKWGEWGSESGWTDTKYADSDSRKCSNTRSVPDKYNMETYVMTDYDSPSYRGYYSYRPDGILRGHYTEQWNVDNFNSAQPLTVGQYYDYREWNASDLAGVVRGNGTAYRIDWGGGEVSVPFYVSSITYKTQYKYKTRSKIYTYYLFKDSPGQYEFDPTGYPNIYNVTKEVQYRAK